MQEQTSKITKVIEETHDSFSIQFERPKGLDYLAGQYGLFSHDVNGEMVKRSYSFSSSPTEDFLQITVKRMPHGKMSNCLTNLPVGEELKFMAPLGKFILEDDLKEVVFIAGGSGISPFRCMTKYVLDKKLD